MSQHRVALKLHRLGVDVVLKCSLSEYHKGHGGIPFCQCREVLGFLAGEQ